MEGPRYTFVEEFNNADLQCASYALEMLSHGGLRSHAMGLLITDDKINLLYYDRSVVVKASAFSLAQDPVRFVAMLYAMSCFQRSQWGFDPAIEEPQYLSGPAKTPRIRDDGRQFETFEKTEMRWKDETTITLGKEIFHQHSIIGRGTWVLEAEVKIDRPNDSNDTSNLKQDSSRKGTGIESASTSSPTSKDNAESFPIVVKFSYVPKSRKSEVEIVRMLRGKAFQDESNRAILDHLPLILDARDHPAGGVRRMLKDFFDKRDQSNPPADTSWPTYEERVLRITLQESLLPLAPLREKKNRGTASAKFAKIFQDVFKCKSD